MSGQNKCWQYYTTKNDVTKKCTVVFKLHFINKSNKKPYTNAVKHIYRITI